jgi:hypothetical protein
MFDLLWHLFHLWRIACWRPVMENWRDPTIKFIYEEIKPMRRSPREIARQRSTAIWTFILCTAIYLLFVVTSGSEPMSGYQAAQEASAIEGQPKPSGHGISAQE